MSPFIAKFGLIIFDRIWLYSFLWHKPVYDGDGDSFMDDDAEDKDDNCSMNTLIISHVSITDPFIAFFSSGSSLDRGLGTAIRDSVFQADFSFVL